MLSWQYVAPIRDTEVGKLLQFSFYWMVVLLVGAPVLAALGKPARRYTLPAPSILLVAVPMLCGMLTVFAEYAGVALSLNAVFDAGWPILVPGLLATVLIAWCQAVLWSTSNSEGLQALTCLGSSVPLLYGIKRWAPVYDGSRDEVLHVGIWHILVFGLATTVCVVRYIWLRQTQAWSRNRCLAPGLLATPGRSRWKELASGALLDRAIRAILAGMDRARTHFALRNRVAWSRFVGRRIVRAGR